MTIRPFLSGQPFEPEAIVVMSSALAAVCEALRLSPVDDAVTRLVAKKIIELTQRGIRDSEALTAAALKELRTGDRPEQIQD